MYKKFDRLCTSVHSFISTYFGYDSLIVILLQILMNVLCSMADALMTVSIPMGATRVPVQQDTTSLLMAILAMVQIHA